MDGFLAHPGRSSVVAGVDDDLLDDVTGVAGIELDVVFPVVIVHQVIERLFVEINPAIPAEHLENGLIFPLRRMVDLDLVGNPPQKCFIHQAFRFEIGGENREHIKGDGKLHAGMEGHEVDPPVKGDDPAVEEILRFHLLSAEVVGNEDPVVGLHLERGLVVFRDVVEIQIEHSQSQFAAGYHHRSLDLDPALVDTFVRFTLDRGVIDRIENSDDFSAHGQRIGNIDRVRDQPADGLGDGGLAVARRSIDEHGLPGADGRTESLEDGFIQNQVGKGFLYEFFADDGTFYGLGLHHETIVFQRHRSGAGIAAEIEEFAGTDFTGIGYFERVRYRRISRPSFYLDEFVSSQGFHYRFNDGRRELAAFRQVGRS